MPDEGGLVSLNKPACKVHFGLYYYDDCFQIKMSYSPLGHFIVVSSKFGLERINYTYHMMLIRLEFIGNLSKNCSEDISEL